MFIFDKCYHSSAALTPIKYGFKGKNLLFTKLKKFCDGEINEQY